MPSPLTTLRRTDSSNDDFQTLVTFLDAELQVRDGEEHSFYAQYNKLNLTSHVIVAYENNKALSCGAIKEFSPNVMEVKRMFTLSEYRGRGIASLILAELEKWSKELTFEKCILETGMVQPEAIALYTKNGYSIIPNYGQYAGVENSVCFQKALI